MIGSLVDQAVAETRKAGHALLKFISANEAGATGSHQSGFYLPKEVHGLLTPDKPEEEINSRHEVKITWQNGLVTDSVVSWYGVGSRSEYRLTRFGRGFPFLAPNKVGDLLVLIPRSIDDFAAFVFETEDDIDDLQAGLGVVVDEGWAIFPPEPENKLAEQDQCYRAQSETLAAELKEFPSGQIFSKQAWKQLSECSATFKTMNADQKLTALVRREYELFQFVERKICGPLIRRNFETIDEFLDTASSILNRRKSRAGRSLENHLESLFTAAKIPFEMRTREIQGRPDVVIPGEDAYFDDQFPVAKIFIVGVKTTCKDRWRQVLNEGPRVRQKYLITLQKGISANQLNEMHRSAVQLVVPKSFHHLYPEDTKMKLMSLSDFINRVRETTR